MEVRAHLRYLRIAPRKVRLVINLIRGMEVNRALDQLSVLPKASTLPVTKLLKSAIANAENNFHLHQTDLVIKSIVANEGPKLKRYRPRAFGRAAEILKRMTHVTIVLEDKAKSPAPKKGAKPAKAETTKVETAEVKHAPAKRPVAKRAVKKPVATTKEQERDAQDKTIQRRGES